MLLRETMWEIFSCTGNIDAYLAYRACQECHSKTSVSADESTEPIVLPDAYPNYILREVRWQ